MLEQVLEYIHNMFILSRYPGTYTIADGFLSLDFLKDGQRFWLLGSDMNDGVYTYHAEGIADSDDAVAAGLRDETWAGTICALAVPPQVIALSEEIKQWVEKYGDQQNSPYQSENVIGVYSYTKASGGSGAGGAVTWKDVYGSALSRWRKIAI